MGTNKMGGKVKKLLTADARKSRQVKSWLEMGKKNFS